VGSNLGRREERVLRSIALLERLDGFELGAVSSLYETEPVGIATDFPFINAACIARTSLGPRELLEACASIERSLGRQPSSEPRDRPIDIDLLLYDDAVIDEPGLSVPHPRMRSRLFVLVPLDEIAPALVVPPDRRSVRALRETCRPGAWVRVASSRGRVG